jgi:cobalamin synthase
LVGALSGALLAAFAASVFGVFTVTLWRLADRLGVVRLSVITVLSVAAMVVYLITQHGLWERPEDQQQRRLARLFNVTTAATLTLGVLVFYAALLAIMTVTVSFVVDSVVLGETLGHPPSWADYLGISWFIASLATVGGALGSGAEDADTVRRAAYGARQRARSEEGRCRDAAPDDSG